MNIQELIKELQKHADRPYDIRVMCEEERCIHPILEVIEDEGHLYILIEENEFHPNA